MKNKEIGIILFVIIWIFASYYAYQKMYATPSKKTVEKMVEVLVSKRAIQSGTKLSLDDIQWKEIRKSEIKPDDIKNNGQLLSTYLNRSLMITVKPNEIIKEYYLPAAVIKDRLSRRISQNKYAITIEVSLFNSKFIIPGDYIDVFLTKAPSNQAEKDRANTARILSGIRVLAVGNTTDNSSVEDDKNGAVSTSLTLEVTSRQASMLALSKSLGTLSIGIHSSISSGKEQQINLPDNQVDYNSLNAHMIKEVNNKDGTESKKIILYHGNKADQYYLYSPR